MSQSFTGQLPTDIELPVEANGVESDIVAHARFRDMCAADLGAVLAVERQCYDFPWSKRVFQDCLKAGYICKLVERSQQVQSAPAGSKALLGHGILMLGPGEMHILNFCVLPECRGTGLSVKLLQYLLDTAKINDAKEVFLEVRRSNDAARKLYEANGFNRIAVRKDYYDAAEGREDALLYALTLVN